MATGHPQIVSASELPDYISVLEEFLHRPDAPYHGLFVTELDGYFAGILTNAEMIMPSEWLPPIWGGDDPEFDNEAQAQEILGAIMDMYNDINQSLENGTHTPLYDIDNDDTPMWEVWIEGFWIAAMLRRNTWLALLKDEGNPERQQAAMVLSRLHQLSHRSETGIKLTELDDVLLESAADGIPVAVEALHKHRKQPLAPGLTNKKLGRNEPCPCGSGKKFKKCCLQ